MYNKLFRKLKRFYLKRKLFVICCSIFFTVIFVAVFKYSFKKPPNQTDLVVEVSPAKVQAMPILLQAPGIVEAERTVSISPQVTGIIKHIAFRQGETVKKGQLLFEIEPAPFLESLNQAKAILKRDEATLYQNKLDAKRYTELSKLEYVTKQQAEQAVAVAQAQAAIVESDLAQVRQAEIQLGYTKIYSPIHGKTGNITLHTGDLAIANNNILVTVNQLNPIWIDFNLTQNQLKVLLNHQKNGPLQVEIFIDDNIKLAEKGELIFIDNNINQQTATVLLKAKIHNPDYHLWPGMMVNTQLILAIESKSIVIPIGAVQIDQEGQFVYSVEKDKAKIKRIEVSRIIDGLAVISKGLIGTEQIITTISPSLAEGANVRISPKATFMSHPPKTLQEEKE